MNECTSNGSEWWQYHQRCTTNNDEATCLEIDDPSEGIGKCTVVFEYQGAQTDAISRSSVPA